MFQSLLSKLRGRSINYFKIKNNYAVNIGIMFQSLLSKLRGRSINYFKIKNNYAVNIDVMFQSLLSKLRGLLNISKLKTVTL